MSAPRSVHEAEAWAEGLRRVLEDARVTGGDIFPTWLERALAVIDCLKAEVRELSQLVSDLREDLGGLGGPGNERRVWLLWQGSPGAGEHLRGIFRDPGQALAILRILCPHLEIPAKWREGSRGHVWQDGSGGWRIVARSMNRDWT